VFFILKNYSGLDFNDSEASDSTALQFLSDYLITAVGVCLPKSKSGNTLQKIQQNHSNKSTNYMQQLLQFITWSWSDWPYHDQQHCYHHAPTVKPEAATAVVELLMIGVRMPKTC
jgi:hypothetical protein